MSDREDRGNRLGRRFEDEPDESQTDESNKTDKLGNNSNPSKTENEDKPSLKDETKAVMMYLPKDVATELDISFDELNAKHKREYDEPLEKNRDYYAAVVEAGLEGKDVEDVLGI